MNDPVHAPWDGSAATAAAMLPPRRRLAEAAEQPPAQAHCLMCGPYAGGLPGTGFTAQGTLWDVLDGAREHGDESGHPVRVYGPGAAVHDMQPRTWPR